MYRSIEEDSLSLSGFFGQSQSQFFFSRIFSFIDLPFKESPQMLNDCNHFCISFTRRKKTHAIFGWKLAGFCLQFTSVIIFVLSSLLSFVFTRNRILRRPSASCSLRLTGCSLFRWCTHQMMTRLIPCQPGWKSRCVSSRRRAAPPPQRPPAGQKPTARMM